MDVLDVLSNIALKSVGNDTFEEKLNYIIQNIGLLLNVSRVYVVRDFDDGRNSRNEFEWCNTGIEPQIENYQKFPYETVPSWNDFMNGMGFIISNDINELPLDIYNLLSEQKILSVIIYPLYINQKKSGFVGFDECVKKREWSDSDFNILKTICGLITGIYERHIYDLQIRESENNYKNYFNAITDFIIIGNMNGKIVYANNSTIDKLGYTFDELINMNIISLHPEEKQEEVMKVLEEMFKGERDSCPIELISKDKKYFPVETRIWFGKWNGQDSIFGLSKDLSDEQENIQKLTKIFSNNPIMMAITSYENRKFIEVNEMFLKKTGYEKNEVLGKTVIELNLFNDFDLILQQKLAEELNNTGHISNRELQIRCKNGDILYGLFYGDILHTQGKKYFLTVMMDISEQKRLIENINLEKERFNNIIEGSHLGTWEWHIQTGKTKFNERWADILGYTLTELEPIDINTWVKLAHPEDLENSNDLIKQHFNKETKYYECESRMKHKNGIWVWVLDRGKVIKWDNDGNPLVMFGTHTDITYKKEMQQKLEWAIEEINQMNSNLEKRLNDSLEENRKKDLKLISQSKQASMGEMIGYIAHQWKQPLNAISLILQILEEKYINNKLEAEYLKHSINKSTNLIQFLSNTIDDFRNFFKIDKEKVEFKIYQNIEKILSFIEAIYKDNSIKVIKEIDYSITAFGYPNEFSQVILNILNNAKDVLIERKINNPTVYIKVYKENKKSVVSISDNGGGIEKDTFSKIFTTYYTTKKEGTGLGLFMSKEIINRMNGTLSIINNEKGAEFIIVL